MLFNELERETTYKLLRYFENHSSAVVLCIMDNGMEFKAKIDTAYETDNTYNEDYDSEKDQYKEYMAVLLEITEVFKQPGDSTRKWEAGDLIEVWYDMFPMEVKAEDGSLIYKRSSER